MKVTLSIGINDPSMSKLVYEACLACIRMKYIFTAQKFILKYKQQKICNLFNIIYLMSELLELGMQVYFIFHLKMYITHRPMQKKYK